MAIAKKHQNRTKIVALVIILAIVLLGAGVYYRHRHQQEAAKKVQATTARALNSIDHSPATKSDNQANEDRKNSSGSSTQAANTTLDSPATPPHFSVTVSYANSSPDGVKAGATVNGETASGTCTLTLSPASGQNQPVSQAEPTQLSNQSYVCPIIDIAAPKGSWKISVSVSSNGATATGTWQGPAVTSQGQ